MILRHLYMLYLSAQTPYLCQDLVCSAAMSIVVGYLLFKPLGPDHPGCASGNGPTLRVCVHFGGTSFSDNLGYVTGGTCRHRHFAAVPLSEVNCPAVACIQKSNNEGERTAF